MGKWNCGNASKSLNYESNQSDDSEVEEEEKDEVEEEDVKRMWKDQKNDFLQANARVVDEGNKVKREINANMHLI